MNNFQTCLVIDTNILFMALTKQREPAKLIDLAIQEKIILFAPDSVRKELGRVLRRELFMEENLIKQIIKSLPVKWANSSIYGPYLRKTEVKHKSDKPVEALALALNCKILSADKHFKKRVNAKDILKMFD